MFDLMFLLAAFAGGMFGAAVGAIPAFIITGVAAVVAAGVAIITGDGSLVGSVAFGAFLGPHISFAGGVAGAAYAAKKGKLEGGKSILDALAGLNSPDVLVVGGIFGALGYLFAWLYGQIPNIGGGAWTDTIALSVVTTAIIARLVFGSSGLFGKVPSGNSRWVASDQGGWIPWQSKPLQLIAIAVAFGFAAAYVTYANADLAGGATFPVLFWGISAVSLVFLQFGTQVPVTHHVTLPAGLAVVASGDVWWGLAFALLGIFLGELAACVFTSYGDTHIDPPAASIAVTATLLAVFSATGLFDITGIVALVVAVVVAGVGYALFAWLQKEPQATPSAATD
jgi:hypothetical protein